MNKKIEKENGYTNDNRIENSRKNLVKVSRLYYMSGMSQNEIAKIMKTSRSKVSRMLSLARQYNIVKIQVTDYSQLDEELESNIKEHLGLQKVIVVSSESELDKTKTNIGKATAQYINSNLKNNMTLGLAWGSTIDKIISEYNFKDAKSGVEVTQLTGGIHISPDILDGGEVVKKLALKMNLKYNLLQYPMYVGKEKLAKMIMSESKPYFNKMKDIDIAILGLGSSLPERSATYLGGYITLEESIQLIKKGHGADICGHRLNMDGTEADTILKNKIISIPLPILKNIPYKVGIAAGEYKVDSIIAAARGEYINVLIIDQVAAIALISKLEE